ncbi:MAG: transglycosylase SLT domain-containing protein [Gemmatimonadaceae bacterium]
MVLRSFLACATLAVLLGALAAHPAHAQGRHPSDRYDDSFRKYSKRNFGPAFDWRIFKAQGMAESNLDAAATSHVGARGVMQLMPATFREIASKNDELQLIDDPEMNIAAGIMYDRRLWERWESDSVGGDCRDFVFASYNAGRGTMINAQSQARVAGLDPQKWPSIVSVAPKVKRWRQKETLDYLRKIRMYLDGLDDRGRVIEGAATSPVKKK